MVYKPPYTITTNMLNYISEIMKLFGVLISKNNLDKNPQLRRTSKLHSIHSSLAIENNRLTENQVKDIINGKPVLGQQRDILEVKNAIKVYDLVFDINPYIMADLLKCHKIMMEALVDDAGSFRNHGEGLYDGDKVIFIAPPQHLVPSLMEQLFDYLNNYDENIIIKSCVFYYEFEFIHPFSDGNGRIGRFFQTALLAKWESIFAYLPIESIIKEQQSAYYKAIADSNTAGNSSIFIEFMLAAILETIKRFTTEVHKKENLINNQVEKLLTIMEDDIPYTAKRLLELLNLKSRASFKKVYLDPAIENGLVRMTLPDTPNSRNQRYIKTYSVIKE
jgi:Fic family protein